MTNAFSQTQAPTQASLDDALRTELAVLRERDLERTLRTTSRRRGVVVETERGTAIDFSSNDYLGLASDQRLAGAAVRAIAEQGIGSGAARLIAGNNTEHEALERAVADFFGAESALTFSTGYAANVGMIPAIVGRGDVIFSDALNHASLIDGCRLSRAATHVYAHGDPDSLKSLLDQHRHSARRTLIVTDGVFSMDGDTAPLTAIVDLAHRYDAWTYVDDAHAVGVVGHDGRGSASVAGIQGDIDISVGTFGKAFGVAGAFVYGSATLTRYLLNRARSFVFSTGVMPAQAAASREALRIVRAEPELRERLAVNARSLHQSLRDVGIRPIGIETQHILPIVVGDQADTMHLAAALADHGYLVGAVRPPTVPEGTSRLRITVSAAHTPEHIRGFVGALALAVRG
ncbi:MAG: 8-amino-7-oxononanoate synthase [bacterium]